MNIQAGGNKSGSAIWTVGHSTHSSEQFNLIIKSQEIEAIVDVRMYPSSRRYPHFNQAQLRQSLSVSGVDYHHLVKLGGRRRGLKDSLNTAWKHPSFRAYADYMETDGFMQGITELLNISAVKRTAIMCAEAVWWRCHRSLIADYLKWQGIMVTHILNEKKTELHPYTAAASIVDGKLSYRGLLREADG